MTYQVWDIHSKTWSQNSHFYLTPKGILYRAGKNLTKTKKVVFGSGVPDDNGNEIIDGDIIEIGNESPPYLQAVEFKEGQFRTVDDCELISRVACKELRSGCTVRGHIFTHEITPYGVTLKKE